MKFALFYHSLISDWNHGNAHFLRGIVAELLFRGFDVNVYEPRDGWSLQNLREENPACMAEFRADFRQLQSQFYDVDTIDLERNLEDVDVVVVHEWNDARLVQRIGEYRKRHPELRLLFHDTHHRCVSAPEEMEAYVLSEYDGVLAFGGVVRDCYLNNGWAKQAWTWHEAADVRVFQPMKLEPTGDLVWIGNWGDGERSDEIRDYLIQPAQRLGIRTTVHGVRYPQAGLDELHNAGITYRGRVSNYQVPEVFARHRATVHIPRRPYREQLPGIPTIRVFEALSCGIPLVCLHWDDAEELFSPGDDYLDVSTPDEMTDALHAVLSEDDLAQSLIENGLRAIYERHTCAHRVDELLQVVAELDHSAVASESVNPGGVTTK